MNVTAYITKVLKMIPPDQEIKNIDIVHMAGDKAQDSTKLDFIKPFAVKTAETIRPSAKVNIRTTPITPVKMEGKEMSATAVRKDAYVAFLQDNAFEKFDSKYGSFYNDFTREMYDAIIEPAKLLTPEEIQEYINNGTLPSSKSVVKRSVKRKKSAGSRKRYNKNTRKNNKI